MKIAFFSDNFYPEISGISDSIILTAKELVKLGHQVRFYVPKYSPKDYQIARLDNVELNLGGDIKIYRLPSLPYPFSPTKQARIVFPIGFSLRDLKRFQPDIIHTHSPFGTGLEALLAARLLKVKLLGTNHTPITEFLQYSPIKLPLLNSLSLRFFSWYYNRCIFVTAPSTKLLEEMKKFGFNRPCSSLPNPVDLENFTPVTMEQKKQLKTKFKLSDFTVLYTGRLAVEKHPDVIIKAIALVKKDVPQVILAFSGYGSAENKLHQLVKELDLEKNVIFFGRLNDDVYAELYKAADVFTIMSTAETQSLSLMKAMACAMPVIVARSRGLAEYVNSENGLIVEPGDFKHLSEQLIFLYNNHQVGQLLGQGGLHLVKSFSVGQITDRWLKIYREVMA